MRPSTFEETGNLRTLCKERIRPLSRLKIQALRSGDMRAFAHYANLECREILEYQHGRGRYCHSDEKDVIGYSDA